MSIELKIKAKSLAAESAIIRKEERYWKAQGNRELNANLHHHRVEKVRRAARSTHLARGFIRHMPYRTIEAKCFEKPSFSEIQRLLESYGPPEFRNRTKEERETLLKEWLSAS